jgi:hypothetical protein
MSVASFSCSSALRPIVRRTPLDQRAGSGAIKSFPGWRGGTGQLSGALCEAGGSWFAGSACKVLRPPIMKRQVIKRLRGSEPLTPWWEAKMAAGTLTPDDCRRMSDGEIDMAVGGTTSHNELRSIISRAENDDTD